MLEEQLEEMTAWAQSGPADEFRFTLFFVPYVIKKEDQYLVAYSGHPPTRRRTALAVIPRTKSATTADELADLVRKSGICGLMSDARKVDFIERLKAWWGALDGPTLEAA